MWGHSVLQQVILQAIPRGQQRIMRNTSVGSIRASPKLRSFVMLRHSDMCFWSASRPRELLCAVSSVPIVPRPIAGEYGYVSLFKT